MKQHKTQKQFIHTYMHTYNINIHIYLNNIILHTISIEY